MATYEVLYNACYGGFALSDSFIERVFELYPPETTVGEKLWTLDTYTRFIWNEGDVVNPFWDWYYLVKNLDPFVHGYKHVTIERWYLRGTSWLHDVMIKTNYVTKDKRIYYLKDKGSWRDSPEIIALAKAEGLIDKKFDSTCLRVATVPIGYKFEINEHDGMEHVDIHFPYRKVIGELINALQTNSQDALGNLSKRLLDGSLSLDTI